MPVARSDARSLPSTRPRIQAPPVRTDPRFVPRRPFVRTLTRAMRRVPIAFAAIAFAEVMPADAAEPSPAIINMGDSRTADLPELTGGPVEVLVAVVALGIATALLTIAGLAVTTTFPAGKQWTATRLAAPKNARR